MPEPGAETATAGDEGGGRGEPPVEAVEARAFTVPTERSEADGTLRWDETSLVIVHARAAGREGIGFSYTSPAAAAVVEGALAGVVRGRSALRPEAAWHAMWHEVRNLGRPGVVSAAMSAVDVALWDLEARLLDLPLATLLGQVHDRVPVYGSGGFTSYDLHDLRAQLAGWAGNGFRMVKMKVGRSPDDDPARVAAAREAVGEEVELFVDANGAYSRKQALGWAWRFADEWDVSWFEEPVSSNDREGLRLLRDQGPPGMQIAAGEYGWDVFHFRDLLLAGAVDTLQVDVTRCGGYTGFRRAAALCEAHETPLSSHTAPALHVPVCCAAARTVHIEYFHDHARIEGLLFDGAPSPVDGALAPRLDAPGHGLALKESDARAFLVKAA